MLNYILCSYGYQHHVVLSNRWVKDAQLTLCNTVLVCNMHLYVFYTTTLKRSDNILLVALLTMFQIEFESIKLELTQKNEEQEEMRAQLDEAARLKEIAERQLDEALEALKEEREQKNSLRRELSALTLNPFDSVGHLELQLDQLDDSQEEGQRGEGQGEGEDQDSGFNNGPGAAPGSAHPPHSGGSKSNGVIHRFSTPRNNDVFLRAPASGLVSDLLSELQFSDSQKLKQQLLQVGNSTTCTVLKCVHMV